jgi:hypothetical protein
MKNLKEYIVNENNFFKNLGVGQVAQIKKWLEEHNITKYSINDDYTIDVKGDVVLDGYPEKELPDYIQFNYVDGHISINKCKKLVSLKGFPKEMWGSFEC